jgi:hypothetical protein
LKDDTDVLARGLGADKIQDRKRGSKEKKASNSFLESLGIDLSQIQIQIALKDDDKKLIQESLENMSNDVKKYWTRTHILMVLIALGSFAAQVI